MLDIVKISFDNDINFYTTAEKFNMLMVIAQIGQYGQPVIRVLKMTPEEYAAIPTTTEAVNFFGND